MTWSVAWDQRAMDQTPTIITFYLGLDGMVVVGEEETVVKLLFREPEFIAEIKDSHDRKVTRPTKTA